MSKPHVWSGSELGEMLEYGNPGPSEFVDYTAYLALAKQAKEAILACANSIDKRSPAWRECEKVLAIIKEIV